MPAAQLVDELAALFTYAAVQDFDPDLLESLSQPRTLLSLAQEHLEGPTDYLSEIPEVLREGIRASIVEAVNDHKAVHFHYTPGYDFRVRLAVYGDALSVHVSGPTSPTSA